MPQAPMLPPDQMAQAQATGGVNPANFLIAASQLQGEGKLSAPVPTGASLPAFKKPSRRPLKVLK